LFTLVVLCIFLGCTKKENAVPQEIPASSDGGLHAATIAEEAELPTIQQASEDEELAHPAVQQISVEIPAEQFFSVSPEPKYFFQPLASDEMLMLLRVDENFFPTTIQMLAISQERNAYRLIHEFTGKPSIHFSDFKFSDDRRSAIWKSDYDIAPLYHIDGENGVLSYLFEVGNRYALSSDGRFIAFVPASQAHRNTLALFSVEAGDVIAQFAITIDEILIFSPFILQEGQSDFRLFNVIDHPGFTNAEGVLDTENLTLQMNKISGFAPELNHEDMLAVRLNNFPRLRHSLNIELPFPAHGRSLIASELVNVYSEPDFSSEIIQSVERLSFGQAGYYFELHEIGDAVVFDGISSHWAYVELCKSDGQEGWSIDTFGWVFLGLMIY